MQKKFIRNAQGSNRGMIKLLTGDALTQLKTLDDECVDMTITSPPYYCKECGETNVDKLVRRGKAYRYKCKKCMNNYMKKRYAANRPHMRATANKLYANNREKIIKQKVTNNLKYRRLARLDCIEYYSNGTNQCECCSENHLEFLCIDHINGGGNKHRQKIGEYLPLHLKKQGFPPGYRILCHNCNMSMGFYGYCPHEKEYMEMARRNIFPDQTDLFLEGEAKP